MALELEQIQPWDGQSGTGAEVRGALNRNFEKLKDLSILAGMPIKDLFTSVDLLPRPGISGNNYLVGENLYVWSESVLDYVDIGSVKGQDGLDGIDGKDSKQVTTVAYDGTRPVLRLLTDGSGVSYPVPTFSKSDGSTTTIITEAATYTNAEALSSKVDKGGSDKTLKMIDWDKESVFAALSDNMVDLSQFNLNKTVDANGNIVSSTTRHITGYIPVVKSLTYTGDNLLGTSDIKVHLFDVSGAYIGLSHGIVNSRQILVNPQENGYIIIDFPTGTSNSLLNLSLSAIQETRPYVNQLFYSYIKNVFKNKVDAGFMQRIKSQNLYDPLNTKWDGWTLSYTTGAGSQDAYSGISDFIRIDPLKSYAISGYKGIPVTFPRSFVFYDENYVIVNPGWGTDAFALSNVGIFSEYILRPISIIPYDWKTNGKNQLPIPANAVYVRFNVQKNINIRFRLQFEELSNTDTKASPFVKFGFHEAIHNDSFSKNLFSYSKRRLNSYIQESTGLTATQNSVNGLVFSTSGDVAVEPNRPYSIHGRKIGDGYETHQGVKGIVFYDEAGNRLKPRKEDGSEYPTFASPSIDSVIYSPPTAVSCELTTEFYAPPGEIEYTMMFTKQATLTPFHIKEKYVGFVVNSDIPDGWLMVKKGNSYYGIDPSTLGAAERDFDGIYRIIDYVTSAIQKTKYLELEHVNSDTIPVMANSLICEDENGNLLYVKNGVKKTIQVI